MPKIVKGYSVGVLHYCEERIIYFNWSSIFMANSIYQNRKQRWSPKEEERKQIKEQGSYISFLKRRMLKFLEYLTV